MSLSPNKNANNGNTFHLHQHAAENLRFIRASMESASAFTGVSGKGYVLGGISAVAASWLAAQQAGPALWLSVWMLELLLAAALMLSFTIRKTQSQGSSLFASASGKKLLLAFLPAMFVGGVLTLIFLRQGLITLLPTLWLSLYGAAVITAGAYSVKVIPVMGILFIALGLAAGFSKINSDLLMGLGFGGLHLVFGTYIWNRHGG